MPISRRLRAVAVLAAILSLTSCTTYVSTVKKDDAYQLKLTETAVYWQPPPDSMQIRISRSSPGLAPVFDKDMRDSQTHIRDLMMLYQESAASTLGIKLSTAGVNIVSSKTGTLTPMSIRPTSGSTTCTPLGCVHNLWLEVKVFDRLDRKTVWSESFKVGAGKPSEDDQRVVDSFANFVVQQLRWSDML